MKITIAARLTIAVVGLAVIVVITKHHSDVQRNRAEAAAAATAEVLGNNVTLPQRSIQGPAFDLLTKVPDFARLIAPELRGDQLLSCCSQPFIDEQRQIDAAAAAMSDPDLRQHQIGSMWATFDATHDKVLLAKEAKSRIEANNLQVMRRVITEHTSGWFEMGHVTFQSYSEKPGPKAVTVWAGGESATPTYLLEAVHYEIPLTTLDKLYSRFS